MKAKKSHHHEHRRHHGLPEPAQSIALELERSLQRTHSKEEAHRKAVAQAQEWLHSRAPAARAATVRGH